jgi:cell wall-associated NlpC family hydrolase
MRLQWIVLLLVLAGLDGPARAEPDGPTPALTDAGPAIVSGPVSDLTLYALSLNGTAYKFGGRDPETGLDCSGFVGHVFSQAAGVKLPATASAISQVGKKIGVEELRPGDLVFFNTLRRAFSHVGIYLGNNQFIHASSSKTGDVMVSDMTESYWSKRFTGARRIEAAPQ